MVNVGTQLSAKMEAPYGEYSVPSARAAGLASLGERGWQRPAAAPSPTVLPPPQARLEVEAGEGFWLVWM